MVKNQDDMLCRFHLITERHGQTDGQTDGRTDGRMDRQTKLLSISRVSVLTRDKNRVLSYGSKKKAYDRRILSGGELTSYHSVCEAWCHFVFFHCIM